jgi:hypothetical protein
VKKRLVFVIDSVLYEVGVIGPTVVSIRKTLEDSGMTRDVQLDNLPTKHRNHIIKGIEDHDGKH